MRTIDNKFEIGRVRIMLHFSNEYIVEFGGYNDEQ